MDNALVVSASRGSDALLEVLCRAGYDHVQAAASGQEARRLLPECHPQLVLINSPLPDETGMELARIVSEGDAAAILLVRSENAAEYHAMAASHGIFLLEKPLHAPTLFQALRFVATAQVRVAHLQEQNRRLERRLQEMRLISHAKCLLVEQLHLSEEQAHRFIEKQAMDQRQSRAAIAETIVNRLKGNL